MDYTKNIIKIKLGIYRSTMIKKFHRINNIIYYNY